jgi:7,8-dihydroneopterin aldolase/epimerase/oxygenase
VNDSIHIRNLEVFAHLGVTEEERAAAQRLSFHLTLSPTRPMDELNDDIGRAVNYAAVCDEVKKFIGQRRDKLIETLADALASHLLETFEIRRITVELRKYILPEVEFVSVMVTRECSKE